MTKRMREALNIDNSPESPWNLPVRFPESQDALDIPESHSISIPESALPIQTPQKAVPDLVPLRVYATLANSRWDQLAGFVHWARNLAPRTMQEWKQAQEEFNQRPVG